MNNLTIIYSYCNHLVHVLNILTISDRMVAWSVGLSVGLSVTLVSPAKTAELIEIPFGLRTRVGSGNHVLDGGPDAPWQGATLG